MSFELETGLKVTRSDKGFIELSLPGCDYPLRLLLTPYASESRLKKYLGGENQGGGNEKPAARPWKEQADKYCDDRGVNILLAHLFMIKQGDPVPRNRRMRSRSFIRGEPKLFIPPVFPRFGMQQSDIFTGNMLSTPPPAPWFIRGVHFRTVSARLTRTSMLL